MSNDRDKCIDFNLRQAKRNSILNSSSTILQFKLNQQNSIKSTKNEMIIENINRLQLSPKTDIDFRNDIQDQNASLNKKSSRQQDQKNSSNILDKSNRSIYKSDNQPQSQIQPFTQLNISEDQQTQNYSSPLLIKSQQKQTNEKPSSVPLIIELKQLENSNTRNSLLAQRKSGLKNLVPLDTQTTIVQQSTNAPSSSNFDSLKINNPKSLNTNSNGNSPQSGGMTPGTRRKLLMTQQQANNKRRETLMKFQHAVRVAVQQQKQREMMKKTQNTATESENLLTTNYLITRTEPYGKISDNVPMTPMLKKNKMSFFDVVKKLNPFKKQESRVIQDEEEKKEQSKSNRASQILRDKELQEQRRKRAQQLWRKAKSVLRAINIWKQIQSDIQLYGTHNYEFRQNFQVTQNKNLMTKTTQQRKESIEDTPRKRIKPFIHPESRFKKIWQFIMMLSLLYAGTIMPFKISFFDYHTGDPWHILDLIADFIFLVDVFVNSFSAFYDDDGKLVTNNKRIFMIYFKGWFFWDLLACLPISLLEKKQNKLNNQIANNFNQIIRLFRLPRLYVLVKITKLSKVLGQFKKNSMLVKFSEFVQLNAGILRLLTFALGGCICIHVSACFWYLSSKISDFEPDTWIVRSNAIDDSYERRYLLSIYWSVSTVLTVGYGDVHAETNSERLISVAWMMIGVIFYSFTIGLLTAILGKIDSRSSQLKSKLEVIEEFCVEAYISLELKRKIKEALEYHSNRNAFSYIENYSILTELPPNLKCEIAMQIHNGKIGKLPFFSNKDQSFIGNVVPLLQPLRVLAHDYIYMLDDHPYEIYFIVEGRVDLIMEIGECVFKSWPSGAYFGEIEIIFQKKRICTAKAQQHCDLFTLNKKYYQTTIYNDYPEIEKQLRELALLREAKINQTLEKAKVVLESIGIQDALLLPPRQKRNSITSQNTTSKRRRDHFKLNAMKKVVQSFDEAHKSMSMSEPSKKSWKQEVQNSDSKVEEDVKEDHQSSSSGDFNIWGEEHKSESEDSKKDARSTLSQKRKSGESNKSHRNTEHLERFNEYFNTQKQSKKDRKSFSSVKNAEQNNSSNLDSSRKLKKKKTNEKIKSDSSSFKSDCDSSSSSSNHSNSSSSSSRKSRNSKNNKKLKQSIHSQNLPRQQTQFLNQDKIDEDEFESTSSLRSDSSSISIKENDRSASSEEEFENHKKGSDDSIKTSNSLKSGFNGSLPQINIIEDNNPVEQPQADEQILDIQQARNYLIPLNLNNLDQYYYQPSTDTQYFSGPLSPHISNGDQQNVYYFSGGSTIKKDNEEDYSPLLQKQYETDQVVNEEEFEQQPKEKRRSLQEIQEEKFNLQMERIMTEEKINESVDNNNKDNSSSDHSNISSFHSSTSSLNSSDLVLRKKIQNQNKLQSPFSKIQPSPDTPQQIIKNQNKNSNKNISFTPPNNQLQQQQHSLHFESQVFKIQVIPPRKSKKDIFEDVQTRQLKEMSGQLKRVKGHFQENHNQHENMEFKVQTLQQTMDLMAKMLKDIGNKQRQKQFQSHRDEIKKRDPFQTKKQLYDGSIKRKQNYDYITRIATNVQTSEISKHSFTLDSNDSLIPIKRQENSQRILQSTTVDDRRKDGVIGFSYSDDLELLQRDYADVCETSKNHSLPDQ